MLLNNSIKFHFPHIIRLPNYDFKIFTDLEKIQFKYPCVNHELKNYRHMNSKTKHQVYRFPLLPNSEILQTLSGWGLNFKGDRVLHKPSPDFITEVLRVFVEKLGYRLDKLSQVTETTTGPSLTSNNYFDQQSFSSAVDSHFLVSLCRDHFISKWGFEDLINTFDVFLPDKSRTKRLLSCMIYVVQTKEKLNAEINPK